MSDQLITDLEKLVDADTGDGEFFGSSEVDYYLRRPQLRRIVALISSGKTSA